TRNHELGSVDLQLGWRPDYGTPASDHTLWRADHPVHHAGAARTVRPVVADTQLLQGLAVLVLTEKLNIVPPNQGATNDHASSQPRHHRPGSCRLACIDRLYRGLPHN